MTADTEMTTGRYRQFLIDCLNSRRDASTLHSAAEFAATGGVDWEALWSMAAAERIAPLLFHTTRAADILPRWLLDRCHDAYLETGIHNALRQRELTGLLKRLSDEAVPAVVLKGAALIEQVYGNLALRPMVDIDLLVRKEDALKSLAIVEQCGFRQEGREVTPGATLAYENEILLLKEGRQKWYLELHWSLFDSPFYQQQFPVNSLWESADRITIEGVQAYGLAVEWMLLHLCGHLTLHHRQTGLLWWNDIAELISKFSETIDWPRVFERAQFSHLVLSLQSILPAVAEVWLAPAPEGALGQLAALVPSGEEARMYKMLTTGYAPPGLRLLADARGIDSWAERARFVLRNLFPTGDYMDKRYHIKHRALRVFYYFYRWFVGLSGLLRYKFRKFNSTV